MARRRLDAELVAQGFFSSQDLAMRAVLAGEVSGESERYVHPGMQVKPGIKLHVRNKKPFVSRGGIKLEGALDAFNFSVEGLSCLDIGCSTGGFTDCLLRRGASSVVAVDVGYAQFDFALRQDRRVQLHERINILDFAKEQDPESLDLAVCDVSFTSVLTILPAVVRLLKPEAVFISLIKPQFELGRDEVASGGIVHEPQLQKKAIQRVVTGVCKEGFELLDLCSSPIQGHKGNQEFFAYLRKSLQTYAPEAAGLETDSSEEGSLELKLSSLTQKLF